MGIGGMRDNSDTRGVARRRFLKTSAGLAGAGLLAGCTGGGNGNGGGGGGSGPTDMVMKTSTETTAAYAMSQGIASAVNKNSDSVRIDARPSEGTNANVGSLQQDKAQIAYIQNWAAEKLMQGEKPFDSISFQPNQVMHFYDLGWFFATGNKGWKTTADIESGSRVSPTPRGSGTAEMLETALGYTTEDYERVSIDYGSQGSAISEGRLDVGAATFVNMAVEPSWLQDMKSQNDLRILGFPDDAVSKMEEHPGIILSQVDMGQFDGYAYTPNPLNSPTLSYNFVVRNDFSYDAVYEFLSTLYEQRDGLGEYHGLLKAHAKDETWVKNSYEQVPFHPAAADFYQEQGLWNDSWTRGKE